MIKTTLGLRIFAAIVIVFGSVGMYFVWSKIYDAEHAPQEQAGTASTPTDGTNNNGDDTNGPIVSDYVPPTSTDPTSRENIGVPSTPSENPKLVPTPKALTCQEIRDATLRKCQADCPAEPDIAIYNACTAGCDKIDNLFDKSDCTNKCISDWSKAKDARSNCMMACLDAYYATDCP